MTSNGRGHAPRPTSSAHCAGSPRHARDEYGPKQAAENLQPGIACQIKKGQDLMRGARRFMMSIKFPNPTDKYVGSRVRMRRLMLHMSQERLADQLGLTFQQVQKYEKGTNRISASRLQEISHILEVPVPFFFEGAPHSFGGSRKSSEGPSLAYITDFLGNADGHALVRAFIKIKNASLRRSVVRLVEAIVSSGDS